MVYASKQTGNVFLLSSIHYKQKMRLFVKCRIFCFSIIEYTLYRS